MEEKILNLEYKLVGTLNKLDVIPELVYPVFENEGQYFLQSPSNPLKIETFDFLFNEEMFGLKATLSCFVAVVRYTSFKTIINGDTVWVIFPLVLSGKTAWTQ